MKSPSSVFLAMVLWASLVATAPADLVNYWTFDSDGVDLVTSNAGTFMGDAAVTTAAGEARVGAGSLKIAHNTAGAAGDYFKVQQQPIIPIHGVYTVTGWYKWDTSFSSQPVDARAHVYETTPNYSSSVGIYTNEYKTAFWADGTTSDITKKVISPNAINDGSWHFFAVAYDAVANVASYYHDGQFQSTSIAPPIVYPQGLNIGAYRSGGDRNWQGYIDDFAIYEGIVPSADIQKLYNGTATPQTVVVDHSHTHAPVPTGNLVAYWQFDSDFNSEVNADYFASTPQGNTQAATYTSIDTTAGAAVRGAGALKLDSGPSSGNGTYVKVDGSLFDHRRDRQVAISAWFKCEDISSDGSDLRNMVYETSSNYSVSLGVLESREYQWYANYIDSNSPANQNGVGDSLIEAGEWYHVVTNYDLEAGRMQMFCNGVLVSDEPLTGTYLDYIDGFNIGNHRTGDGTRDFDGYIDDVAVFHGVLSPEGVAGLYGGAYSPLTVPVFRDFAAIPEPAVATLLLAGLTTLLGARRRRG